MAGQGSNSRPPSEPAPPRYFEFAELLCGRVEIKSDDPHQPPIAMMTIQFMAFPMEADRDPQVQPMQMLHVAPEQFPHLLEALEAAIRRHFPNWRKSNAPSGQGSGGSSPARH